jgi:LPS sulfotransferase NodH
MRGYAICAEPRSGSSFLGYALACTGVLGRPLEYFNTSAMRKIPGFADYPDEPESQRQAVLDAGASPNGVYAVKVFGEHFAKLNAVRWLDRLPSLRLIHLERRDRLGQAISFVRAMQTRQWTAWETAGPEPTYDRGRIDKALRWLGSAELRWRYYFARNGLDVLTLVYEEVARSPQNAAEAIGEWIGLSETPTIDTRRLSEFAIQRDALSEAWRARFVAEARDVLTLDDGVWTPEAAGDDMGQPA